MCLGDSGDAIDRSVSLLGSKGCGKAGTRQGGFGGIGSRACLHASLVAFKVQLKKDEIDELLKDRHKEFKR